MRSAVLAAFVVALAVAPHAAGVGEPKRAITKADQARARSVLLQRGDLGAGFVARRQTDSELPDDPKCRSLRESDLTITGDATSPDFTLQATGALVTVGSTAQVYRTVREANASWARGTGSQAAACLAALVRRSAGDRAADRGRLVEDRGLPQARTEDGGLSPRSEADRGRDDRDGLLRRRGRPAGSHSNGHRVHVGRTPSPSIRRDHARQSHRDAAGDGCRRTIRSCRVALRGRATRAT